VSENHTALYEESLKHPEQFWGDLARRRLRWTKEFDQVMDCDMTTQTQSNIVQQQQQK
jgi:acetyl-CoA synthetase